MLTEKSVFDENLDFLKKVVNSKGNLDKAISDCVRCQLREIYNQTENSWFINLKHFNSDVKYLLICEAPPWTMGSTANYFYLQPKGQLFNTIRRTFFGTESKNRQKTYARLAKKGFLLIDSLPYGFPYTTKQRKSTEYLELVKECVPWWLGKLESSGLTFSKELKIALGYHWNGRQVINACGGSITIHGNTYTFNKSHIISHKGSRFLPDGKKLKRVYKKN